MTKDQISKQESFDKIENCKTENLVALTPYPGVITACGKLKTVNDNIKTLTPLQATDETGVPIDKTTFKQVYVNKILINSRSMCAYYFDKGDMTNFNKFNYSESRLMKARPSVLLIAGDATFKNGTDNLTILTGYVTTASLAEINVARDVYAPKANLPAEIKTEGGLNTAKIDALFVKGGKIVNFQYKNALGAIKDTLPDIYNKMMAFAHDIKVGVRSHHAPSVPTTFVDFKFINKITLEAAVGIMVKVVGIEDVYMSDELGMLSIEMKLGLNEIKVLSFEFEGMQFALTVVEGEQLIEKEVTPLVA